MLEKANFLKKRHKTISTTAASQVPIIPFTGPFTGSVAIVSRDNFRNRKTHIQNFKPDGSKSTFLPDDPCYTFFSH